ncbi:MAG: prepilin-type N-terminal cleavage/methylation domain-containing protein [Puniceicoccales bacterium]|jgi:prepilin-type N-terminal cleavage/methylation domain-containing protein|nr:prepilin-type N-terminal cleavage/methylation domain-containing protein [Puniceicoccales bacterium]
MKLPATAATATARKARRPAFTLLEVLAVVFIMAIFASIVTVLSPANPKGREGAQNVAENLFNVARGTAALATNPDPQPEKNPLFNIRARLIVLKDKEGNHPDDHLRRIRIIIGGTKKSESTALTDYRWYCSEALDAFLPDGFYMVPPDDPDNGLAEAYRSKINLRDGGTYIMRLNYNPDRNSQNEGSGDSEWYYYEFNNDGTSNMNSSTFIVAKGSTIIKDGGKIEISFDKDESGLPKEITGLWVASASSRFVPFDSAEEMRKLEDL